jgi:hypothetical protein
MIDPNSFTEIKKRVLRGQSTKFGPVGLYVGEYADEMWASNRFWMTRAARVAPLLDKFNLSPAEPGSYEVNGSVRPATGQHPEIGTQPPAIGKVMVNLDEYQPGIRVRVASHPAYTRDEPGGPLWALYLMADGTHAGLMADELDWLSDTQGAPLAEGHHFGEVRVLFRRTSGDNKVMALVKADVTHVISPAHYTDKVEGQAQEYVPAVTESAEPCTLALVMGRSYGA